MIFWICAAVIVLVIGAALFLRTRCAEFSKEGVGHIHVHGWPYWFERKTTLYYCPEDSSQHYYIDADQAMAIKDVGTVLEAMAIVRAESARNA